MANYIISILRTDLPVVLSWGVDGFRAIKDGLAFRVRGFLFNGIINIIYEAGSDTFNVRLIKGDEITKEITDVYIDNLVDVIDWNVEKDCSQKEYEEKVSAAYGC